MQLYLVERTDKWSYDDYDSFVCWANSPEEAKKVSPCEFYEWRDHPNLKEHGWYFKYHDGRYEYQPKRHDWPNDLSLLKVIELSRPPTEPTTVLASFNAG